MTQVDILTACDGDKDVWQTAVQVAKTVCAGADLKAVHNIVCSSAQKAPAGSPVIKVTDKTGRVLVGGSGAFFKPEDVAKQVKEGASAAGASAAIGDAMATVGAAAGGDSPKGTNGCSLPRNRDYTIAIAASGGADMWQAAVQAGNLRSRVQELARLGMLPAVQVQHGAAAPAAPVEVLATGALGGGGLGMSLCSGGSCAEVEKRLASA